MSESPNDEFVYIKPEAFVTLILHTFRFWPIEKRNGDRAIAFGLLIGYIDGNTRFINKIQPICHNKENDYSMDDRFLKFIQDINSREFEMGGLNEVIGWYRSSDQGIKFSATDIKNHLNFQSKNSKFITLIFDQETFLKREGQYGFSIFRLKGENYYNIMSDYYKIAWEIGTIEDTDQIIANFRNYIRNFYENKPLITEIDEIE